MLVFNINHDVAALADRLRAVSIGEVITKSQVSDALGRDIDRFPWLLMRARKVVNDEHGIVFETLIRVGLRRLPADETHKVGEVARSRIRRTARNANRVISNVLRTANDISNEERLRLIAEQSTLGLLEIASKDRAMVKPEPDATQPASYASAAQALLSYLHGTP